ncbi:hypothetical protein FRZ67_09695 [Panacibacter ginsenosidivorans]|uniref:Uncharacterized protein n=1 Tax=Panacibacter ginsenosidivorans TaxID=1813871 RepID=A0A5B8V9L9_9BACT|nr:hypothetical protein [Panacibacter ginsenosidivorans]QEC67551.1 hypothetical protein FRZ67_09695 [Panacibacter ginsenosidivorans]
MNQAIDHEWGIVASHSFAFKTLFNSASNKIIKFNYAISLAKNKSYEGNIAAKEAIRDVSTEKAMAEML